MIGALKVKEWFEIRKMANRLKNNGLFLNVNVELSIVPSASTCNFCKQFGPIQAQKNFGPVWSGSKLFDTDGIPEIIFGKKHFEQKSADNKKHEKLPSRQRDNAQNSSSLTNMIR